MRILQTDWRLGVERAVDRARSLGAEGAAAALDAPEAFWDGIESAGLQGIGWHQAARDEAAFARRPEWGHAPQHSEWLRLFPEFSGGHPAVVAPYIGLGSRKGFEHALERWRALPKRRRALLADIQGPPMGCGCGNPACRSWDNSPGEKVAPGTYQRPEILFPWEFFLAARSAAPGVELTPILCPECERGIEVGPADDPDGPGGTDLCQGVGCMSPCADDFWPRLRDRFIASGPAGIVLTVDALRKNHPVYGPPRAWAEACWRANGAAMIPVIEPEDAGRFDQAIIVESYRQDCWPEAPPPGYEPSEPPIACSR
jgi:hypothetical protein